MNVLYTRTPCVSNSWDRNSFLTTYAHGYPSVNVSVNTIHRNFIIAGNDGAWFPIDHDGTYVCTSLYRCLAGALWQGEL